jgi:hypothetical protein
MNKNNTQTVANSNNSSVEVSVKGKKGNAILVRKDNGDRIAILKLGKKNLTVAADRINLRAMQAETVAEALSKVCHATGRISLYTLQSFHGPNGVTRIYSSQDKEGNESGYGLFLKKGKKALSFALNRLDLTAMQSENINDAARKAAFTGRLALSNA